MLDAQTMAAIMKRIFAPWVTGNLPLISVIGVSTRGPTADPIT